MAARQRGTPAHENGSDTQIYIVGISGGVGRLLAEKLLEAGDDVRGLVRREEQRDHWTQQGAQVSVGDLVDLSVSELAKQLRGAEAVVFCAGSNGGAAELTQEVDGKGFEKVIDATRSAGGPRLISLSVLPEAWRERQLSDAEELYFRVKKTGDVTLSRSDLDWLILRPSMLVDEDEAGTVSLGPAEAHESISRADVAETLKELLHDPALAPQILELNRGTTSVAEAVRTSRRRG